MEFLKAGWCRLFWRTRDYAKAHLTAQDVYLLIEIAKSRPERDLELKRDLYASFAIPEYWVFDLQNRVIKRYTNPTNGIYQEFTLTEGTCRDLGVELAVTDLVALAFGAT